jgi:hypothetical protein
MCIVSADSFSNTALLIQYIWAAVTPALTKAIQSGPAFISKLFSSQKTHEYFYLKNLLGWHSGKAVDTLEDVKRRIEEVPVPAGYFLLRHPGAINYMYQEGEDYNLALGCKGEEFSGKLVLQHNMVTHHQAAEYRKAIEGVKVAFERD